MKLETLELEDMQRLVGGYVENLILDCISSGDCYRGIHLNFNEEGRLDGLPPNRLFKRADGNVFDIVGDAFICGVNEYGQTIGLTDEQAEKWLKAAQNAPRTHTYDKKSEMWINRTVVIIDENTEYN